MPAEDLLRFIGEPSAYSRWWLVLAALLIVGVITWCIGVLVWTMPAGRLRKASVVGGMHAQLTKRRFVKSVRHVGERHRSAELTSTQACAEMSRVVRSFLSVATGTRAQYLHVSEIADSPVAVVAGAAPLLTDLNRGQFDPAVQADVAALERTAEELISAWN